MGPEKGKVDFLNSTLNLSLTQGQKQIVEEHLFKKKLISLQIHKW